MGKEHLKIAWGRERGIHIEKFKVIKSPVLNNKIDSKDIIKSIDNMIDSIYIDQRIKNVTEKEIELNTWKILTTIQDNKELCLIENFEIETTHMKKGLYHRLKYLVKSKGKWTKKRIKQFKIRTNDRLNIPIKVNIKINKTLNYNANEVIYKLYAIKKIILDKNEDLNIFYEKSALDNKNILTKWFNLNKTEEISQIVKNLKIQNIEHILEN